MLVTLHSNLKNAQFFYHDQNSKQRKFILRFVLILNIWFAAIYDCAMFLNYPIFFVEFKFIT